MNAAAVEYAERTGIPDTGGSDAHILREVDSVVTGVHARTVDKFLDGIRRGESIVVGLPSGLCPG